MIIKALRVIGINKQSNGTKKTITIQHPSVNDHSYFKEVDWTVAYINVPEQELPNVKIGDLVSCKFVFNPLNEGEAEITTNIPEGVQETLHNWEEPSTKNTNYGEK